MKFRKLVGGVELPEKFDNTLWINVRSNKRIDVCFGNSVRVATGVHVTVANNETARITGRNVVSSPITTGELFVTIHNPDKQNLMIYPSQILAEILVKVEPVKASKPKPRKARITSPAKLVGYESK